MKTPEIVVGDVRIGELRKSLKRLLFLKCPRIIYRNQSPVGILLSIEPGMYRSVEHTRNVPTRLRAELEAVIAELDL